MTSRLERVLEPEVMDGPDEVLEYDAMDHSAVNATFADDFLAAHGRSRGGRCLDVGTGTARIPIAICDRDASAQIVAADLSAAMLARAEEVVEAAGHAGRIACEQVDAKRLPWPDGSFEAVISNTIIHHVPEPAGALAEMVRLVKSGGTLFVRDLTRPDEDAAVAALVRRYAGAESPRARQLFEDSLRASLTIGEIGDLLADLGIPRSAVRMTSDRHWTISWKRP